MEFLGTYYHNLDEKGRVSVPKKFRQGLKEGSVVTKGLDGCLFIFPAEYWQELSQKIKNLPFGSKVARDFTRLMTYNAAPIEFDQLGRTRFPLPLANSINLHKEVVFVGALTRIEVWDRETYHQYFDQLMSQENQLTQAIGDLGI